MGNGLEEVTINIPSELTAGETWQWSVEATEYPAPTWSMTFYFINASSVFSIAALGSGATFTVDHPATSTRAIEAGRYQWTARVTDGTDVFSVGDGVISIAPDLVEERDTRTWARRMLDAVEAVMEGRATRDEQSVSFNGRSITRMDFAELRQFRDELRSQVRIEEQGEAAGLGRDVRVRFNRI